MTFFLDMGPDAGAAAARGGGYGDELYERVELQHKVCRTESVLLCHTLTSCHRILSLAL